MRGVMSKYKINIDLWFLNFSSRLKCFKKGNKSHSALAFDWMFAASMATCPIWDSDWI